jgi:hypothetical protein
MCLRIALLVAVLWPAVLLAQRPQVPFITATSLRRGSAITNENSARTIGFNVDTSRRFEATEGVAAVRIQLRTLGKVILPYEVQCFFCAKDTDQARYVYDVVKVLSTAQFDDICVAAHDLFSGSKTTDITNIHQTVSTSDGGTASALAILTREKIVAGSSLEGWIVRVISADRVVRVEASLQELKAFAERESAALNEIAAKVPETK